MPTVNSVGSTTSLLLDAPNAATPVTVAQALTTLKLRPGSTVAIADTRANILKNLDALQAAAGRVTALDTTDADKQLAVSAGQYQKDAAILAKWGAGDGNTLEVTGVAAASAQTFVAAKPAYVNSITVSDSAGGIARNLDSLQSLVSGGSLRQIVQTGASSTLKITAEQLAANGDALNAIKNQAYALAITNASVSDTLGLDGQAALKANSKVKSIEIRDGTDAIEAHLDELQRVGLRLKSISQTDADNPMTVTASQYTQDALAIGKIITPFQLDVIRASAAQAAKLAANQKVVTVQVADTAAHIAKKWSLMQRLGDSLTGIEVTDAANAVTITANQLALGEGLLAKFSDDADHHYQLAVTGVRAGQAATVAGMAHVSAVKVSDTADNISANLADLKSVDAQGLLQSVAITGKKTSLSLDATQLQGDQASATQGVLDKLANTHYGLAVSGAGVDALGDLAANAHVTAIDVVGSSDEIEAHLDTLAQLGRRLARIEQSDSGQAIDVTQSQFEARASVLAKVSGGYTVNLSNASASKALVDAMNAHVASVSVADTGKNLVAHWNALRAIGATLAEVSKTDEGRLALSVNHYLAGQNDGLLGKFSADTKLAVTGASVAQAREIGADDAVEQIDIADDGSEVAASLSELSDLASAGKLHSIALNTTATRLSLHASQLDGAQALLDLINGGRYTLAVDQVAVADAAGLLTSNTKIASMKVMGDAAAITDHLSELTAMGRKLLGIERSDAADAALSLTGTGFEQHQATLAKISGGYQVDLSEVAAAKAAGFAANAQVKSLQVADSGTNLAATWDALNALGAKLTGVAQSDSALLQLSASQWANGQALGDKFSSTLGLSISGASVADAATLGSDDAVQQIQVSDVADTIGDAWADLAANTKLTQIQLSDPATALAMSADTFNASSDLLAKVKDGQYKVALSDVAVADAAGLDANGHVAAMDVIGSSSDIAQLFDSLATLGKLGGITLSDDNGTLTLSATQVLGGGDTFAKIGNGFQISATGVALADLADIEALEDVASIGVSDSAATVAANLGDLVALGGTLASVQLSDADPVLALSQQDWSAANSTLAKIAGSYQVDLSQVDAGSAEALAADTTVRQMAVADTASNLASQWDALVAAYGDGSGKLSGISLTDAGTLTLTADQQTAGAAMITALLPDETILTAA
ncbi:hypothetical protein BurJ1DRAFT_1363 [Burkholderiales bacterium JOSHI_001]|nr:hypothetical protein BurJ1DRAFT_1363 [Burkholderiales bacterium JOSHI_001]